MKRFQNLDIIIDNIQTNILYVSYLFHYASKVGTYMMQQKDVLHYNVGFIY